MIRLKFKLNELYAFYNFLLKSINSIKHEINESVDFYLKRSLKARLSELNACLTKVMSKLVQYQNLGKVQKTYALNISPMQGVIICERFEKSNEELPAYLFAILSDSTTIINKTLA